MNKMKITVRNPALAESLGLAPDETVSVECKNGVPLNREWRNRLKDSTLDGCVVRVASVKPPKKREGK